MEMGKIEAEKALQILKLVEEKTKEKQLEWSPAEHDRVYIAVTMSGAILKMYPFTRNEAGPPSLTLYDSDDTLVFDITFEIQGIDPNKLVSLYNLVKRRVEKTDEKLQAVIDDLSKLGTTAAGEL